MLPDPDVFADQILEATGQRRAPTDVRAMVRKWPALSVVETDLDGDGFFVDLGRLGGEILLKKIRKSIERDSLSLMNWVIFFCAITSGENLKGRKSKTGVTNLLPVCCCPSQLFTAISQRVADQI